MSIFFVNLLDHALDIVGLMTLLYLSYRFTLRYSEWKKARSDRG